VIGGRPRAVLRRIRRSPEDLRHAARWPRILANQPQQATPAVFYGHAAIPRLDEPAHGGMVKFQALQPPFPNRRRGFNLMYLGSSSLPRDAAMLIRIARLRGVPLLWNQNGVAYPAWHGPGWERANDPFRRGLEAAAHVIYQSAFCKLSADRFAGEAARSWEILHNPVDTTRYTPAAARPRELTLLLGGNQYQRYRFETALRALALVARKRPDARLLVTGRLSWSQADDPTRAPREAAALIAELGLRDQVELVGRYTQLEAPAVYRRASLLLHTKLMDPCPTVVLEALATGLPVVYAASGGVPELVGQAAGLGVEASLDWERDEPPAPEAFATAILEVAERLDEAGEAARERAVAQFDLARWIAHHAELFERLLEDA
jgi:glycosyltransferase involved in cell wall biosynthesis